MQHSKELSNTLVRLLQLDSATARHEVVRRDTFPTAQEGQGPSEAMLRWHRDLWQDMLLLPVGAGFWKRPADVGELGGMQWMSQGP